MGRVKDVHFEFINEMNQMVDVDYQFEEYLQSEDYVNEVNEVLEETKPKYSSSDVEQAISYAFNSIIVESDEVGKDVYGKLVHEKVIEYLNKIQ
jgi:hypothetical protein